MSHLIDLKAFFDNDGVLISYEPLPISGFTVERVFWIYNVPHKSVRADHACMNASFVFVAVNGFVTISAEYHDCKKTYTLNNNNTALTVEPGTWVKAYDFSEDAVLICFSDKKYEECVYINNYDEYLMIKNKKRLED